MHWRSSGLDTRKYAHVAVALGHLGARIAAQHVAANREGYAQLDAWAASLAGNGRVLAYGLEGRGSYGVGLASFLRRTGHHVIEVNRGDRRRRRSNGKSDTLEPKRRREPSSAGTPSPFRSPLMAPPR